MQLKQYQEQALRVLRDYLDAVPLRGAAGAYIQAHNNNPRDFFRQRNPAFQALKGLEDVPYVCLRLPTGGGKTLLCAHTVGLAQETLWQDGTFPLTLWMVPSDTIRKQTLETLKNPNHANSRALQEAFGSQFRVFDIGDVVNIRPQDLKKYACIVVSTFAALRVTETQDRLAYQDDEDFEGHFAHIDPNTPGLERNPKRDNAIAQSFVNLLHVQRPLVLVDEAHNAKSPLSMEVLKRVNPRVVIEYTATPADNSNIIESVSAQDLKDEEMIKLPVVLQEHAGWQQAIAASIQTRARLEQAANKEADYLRPLVLFQAENKNGEVTVEVLKQYLCEEENIPAEHIAIATGEQRELDGLNLFDPYCPVRYIITVKALKEGWDCSFAYVLCALANTRSNTEVEQLLGRVLRMPYARARSQPELNQAYAHVSSQSWTHAVSQMEDRLISMGFEQSEADRALQLGLGLLGVRTSTPPADSAHDGPLFTRTDAATFIAPLSQAPNLTALDAAIQAQVTVTEHDEHFVVQVVGTPDAAVLETVAKSISNAKDRRELQLRADKWLRQQPHNAKPAERGVPFIVPQLCFVFDEDITLPLEAENCLGAEGWNPLDDYRPISQDEFSADEKAHVVTLDIENEKLRIDYLSTQNQLPLTGVPTDMDATDLALSMERRLFMKLEGQYMADGSLRQYLLKSLQDLLARPDMNLPLLLRTRVALEKVLETRLLVARSKAYRQAFQQQLFAPEVLRAGADYPVFTFPEQYPVSNRYDGRRGFNKHYYRQIAVMNGEEVECALVLDQHPKVTHWLRNLEKQPRHAFWLPTSTDKFYPDFVAQLVDGRILVVEYKGEHLKNNPDTVEKTAVGRAWAKASGNLFLMAFKQDEQGRDVAGQVRAVLG